MKRNITSVITLLTTLVVVGVVTHTTPGKKALILTKANAAWACIQNESLCLNQQIGCDGMYCYASGPYTLTSNNYCWQGEIAGSSGNWAIWGCSKEHWVGDIFTIQYYSSQSACCTNAIRKVATYSCTLNNSPYSMDIYMPAGKFSMTFRIVYGSDEPCSVHLCQDATTNCKNPGSPMLAQEEDDFLMLPEDLQGIMFVPPSE